MSYKAWRKEHPERARELSRLNYWRGRAKLIQLLGGECWICGSREYLQTHHLRQRAAYNKKDPTYEVINNLQGVVCLCFYHHRRIHVANEESYEMLRQLLNDARYLQYRMGAEPVVKILEVENKP